MGQIRSQPKVADNRIIQDRIKEAQTVIGKHLWEVHWGDYIRL